MERKATGPSVSQNGTADATSAPATAQLDVIMEEGWALERNATGPSGRRTAAPRDLQREGDVLRWRILHYQHSFAHIQAEVPYHR
jgi:hypothetical protein